jgi:hypothetical protein
MKLKLNSRATFKSTIENKAPIFPNRLLHLKGVRTFVRMNKILDELLTKKEKRKKEKEKILDAFHDF